MDDGAVIPQERTAVPVEWDDLRDQLEKLNRTLEPTQPGGVSTLGAFVTTTADNLRGQGANIRDAVIKLSQTLSILGDHSGDLFGTLKNLSVLVSALHDSTDLMRDSNGNLAAVTALLSNDPNEVGTAVADLNAAVTDMRGFLAENRDSVGTTFDKLAEITQALGESSADLKQTLHVAPTGLSNFINIYEPANVAITGALSAPTSAIRLNFICGAIQAASRLGAEQSAKLCVQYLAPIFKNRQYNFLGPIGIQRCARSCHSFRSARRRGPTRSPSARIGCVRITFRPLRHLLVTPATRPLPQAPLPAECAGGASTDPAAGLPGMMVPHGAGS